MNKNIKIALFTDCFYPGNGGTENVIKTLVPLFKNLGDEVRIYAPNYHIKRVNQNIDGFDVFRVPSLRLTDNDNIAFVSLVKKKLENDLVNFSPDIIYFLTAGPMAKWAVKFAKKLNLPLVATLHTKFKLAWYNSTKSHLITNFMLGNLKKFFNETTLASTLSQDAKNTLKSYGYNFDPIIIKNGISKSDTALAPFEINYTKNRFNFLFCGRLEKIKNIQFTLKALYKLKNDYNFVNFNFLIAGSGAYEKTLKRLVKKYNLTDNVVFLGFIRDKAKLNYVYSISQLILFPSIFEMDSLVPLEASSFSLPVLALNGYACGERIEDNVTGFLSNYNLDAFTKRIYEIVTNPSLYEKVRSQTHNLKANTWEEIAKQYHDFFIKAIEKHKTNTK